MEAKLPQDVVQFLLDNPSEVKRIQDHIKAVEENRKWRAEIAEKRKNAKMVPCGVYGCTEPRNEMDAMCPSCYQDYKEDPDAFK